MNLVIVESPAKARTIKKYLGKDFEVMASYGHVRDLIPKEGAVDPVQGFAMHYDTIDRNNKHVKAIAGRLKKADALYLATDPDREGEAISWHLYELLKQKHALGDKPVHRVVFHEITKHAIQEAVEHPRDLSMELVNAQQARRALDYLVGFNLSPLLWKKIHRGLSAGRVQSPALRLIVERELEIEAFKSREYWTIEAKTKKDGQPFKARLTQFKGEKLKQFSLNDEASARAAEKKLLQTADGKLRVLRIEKKQRRRNPAPPFITSTLQQEAARKLGFTTSRTMRVAQQLYEGIDIGSGAIGLITYMRTDSVNLASEAIEEMRAYIAERFGKDLLPEKPRLYKTKSKNAQEAHEAIRPTSIAYEPKQIAEHLSKEQARLYELIWKRALACQMQHALIDTVSADLGAGDIGIFRATGSTISSPGFMRVYLEGRDEQPSTQENENMLPPLEQKEYLTLDGLNVDQHFTEPPPRYNEATLVKSLEEHGIGRPSTYASIISTLKGREYVEMDHKRFVPTDVGRVVNKFLTEYFTRYVDYGFTASLEDELDAVSRGEEEWVPLLERFWGPFKNKVDHTSENVKRSDVTQESTGEDCPQCGAELIIRLGRNGRFIGCSKYPDCDYTRSLDSDPDKPQAEKVEGRQCPKCGSDLVLRTGRYGRFIGCSAYPKCRFLEPLEQPIDTGVICPQCGKGVMMQRKSRKGKVFYSCSTYPECNYATWDEPIAESCPSCGWPILTLKTTKRRGTEKVCSQKECRYREQVEVPLES